MVPFPTSPDEPPALNVSGSRLRAVHVVTDGQRRFVGWFDTKLNVRCDFAPLDGGGWRCLPGHVDLGVWQDAGCQNPALPADPACAGGYVVSTDRALRKVVRRLGPPVAISAQYNQGLTAGIRGCVAQPLQPPAQVFSLGEIVPPETFVARSQSPPERVDADGRLMYVQQLHDDGSKEWLGLYDRDMQQSCSLAQGMTGRPHCMPPLVGVIESGNRFFADSDCQQLAIPGRWPESEPPRRRFTALDFSGCRPGREVFEVEGPVPANVAYKKNYEGRCLPVGDGLTRYYQVARTPTPDEQFVEFQRLPARGRLHSFLYISRTGVLAWSSSDGSFNDTQKRQRCSFHVTVDGQLRCVPAETPSAFFADDACTVPAIRLPRTDCRTEVTEATVLGGSWCAPVARVYAPGPMLGRVFEKLLDGRCLPPLSNTDTFFQGVPQPDDDFVSGQIVTD